MAKPKPNLNIADILERAANLIEPKGNWTRLTSARDAKNRSVLALSPDAICWCAVGAIIRATGFDRPELDLVFGMWKSVGEVTVFNDAPGREQAEVVAMLREGAARVQAFGQADITTSKGEL
jgi:hypothetical protein